MSEPSFLAGRFLPHRLFLNWLGKAEAEGLLAYALAAEARFVPTRLNDHGMGHLDRIVRQSRVLRDLGDFADPLRQKALALQSGLETAFDMTHTPPNSTQIELVAHGDGAFYRPHTDTFTGDEYMSGGRLRLFDLGGNQTIDLEPTRDSLLVFPSTARHEVERISCPDGDFADGRFSVNIWLCA